MGYDGSIEGEAFREQERGFLKRLFTERTHAPERPVLEALAREAEKNPWLAQGAYSDDDPLIDVEYALEVFVTHDVEFLADYLAHGNWALRNGVVLDDLAFVQQVNGGDEWAVFKWDGERKSWDCGSALGSFESVSLTRLAREDGVSAVSNLVAMMQMATPEQCRGLSYRFCRDHVIDFEAAHRRGHGDQWWRVWGGWSVGGLARVEVSEAHGDVPALATLYPKSTVDQAELGALASACTGLGFTEVPAPAVGFCHEADDPGSAALMAEVAARDARLALLDALVRQRRARRA